MEYCRQEIIVVKWYVRGERVLLLKEMEICVCGGEGVAAVKWSIIYKELLILNGILLTRGY